MTPCEEKGYKAGDEFVVTEKTTFPKGARVRLIGDDRTNRPAFKGIGCEAADGEDWHYIHLGRVRKVDNDDSIITRTNGQPFATEASASQQLSAKGLQDTHEVVPHEGGYALAPKQYVPKHKFKVGDKVRVNGYMKYGYEHKYGTSLSIRSWMRKNKTISVVESDSERVKAGDEYISLSFHPSELDLVEQDDPITLQPGDYVSTKDMTEEQYHAVARAFMEAGFEDGEYPNKRELREERAFGIDARSDSLFHGRPGSDGSDVEALCGRHLTIDQVLGATNAKPEDGEDSHCPQDIRAIVNVNLHTKGDAQALRDAFDNLKSGCGDFPTMTATQLDTIADPITTLKQARVTRDEAEQAYQRALEEAREFIGDGFELPEVGADGPLVDGEDMTDPANWRKGDVLVCISTNKDHQNDFEYGHTYTVSEAVDDDGWISCKVENGRNNLPADHFRFHHRPA